MRVWVVGGSGQLGGHLLSTLRAHGHEACGTYSSVPVDGLEPIDLDDPPGLRAGFSRVRPDAVVLAAGWTWVDGNERDRDRSFRLNRDAPRLLAELCADASIPLVHYSTDYVFNGAAGPYAEDDPTCPLNVYGEAKLASEQAVREALDDHLILRTTTVYGPEQQGKNFVCQLVRRLRAGQPFRVPNDQVATPSYGPDVAQVTIDLLESETRGTLHVAGPDALDRAAFAELACEVFELDFGAVEVAPTAELGQEAERPLSAALDTTRLRRLGLRVRGVREGLEDMRARWDG